MISFDRRLVGGILLGIGCWRKSASQIPTFEQATSKTIDREQARRPPKFCMVRNTTIVRSYVYVRHGFASCHVNCKIPLVHVL